MVAVYYPVTRHPFITLDDSGYVVNNVHIRQLNWETVAWSFTTFRAANWHPLTWLSHAVDFHFFALDAGRHHATNLALHALNAVLLFWVLWTATGSRGGSFVVAALFALHPINVESVAWVAERKNLLSMFFFLLALGVYQWYARKPAVGRYLAVALLFALGLMSKPQVITLPFVLLLWDYWPLERMFPPADVVRNKWAATLPPRNFRWLILEKLPLLVLSAASAILTVKAQRAGGTMGGLMSSYSLAARLGNAVVAYVRYLGNALWPAHLAFFYPHARGALPAWQVAAALLFLLAVTALALASNRRYLVVGWLWFLGTLIPMIGLMQVGSQAMADRYAYLPFVGLFFAACWGISDWAEQWRGFAIWMPAGSVIILLLLAVMTRRQLTYWSDDLALWSHTAQVIKGNWMAENQIGETLLRQEKSEDAIAHFRAAAAMEPLFPFPHLHIGIYEEEHRHAYEAIEQFQKVIDLTQKNAAQTPVLRTTAFVHMSYAYNQVGDYANQEKCLNMAAQIQRR